MNVLKKKLKELVYSFSTDDHYAEYNGNENGRSFNMRRRANQGGVSGSRVHLNGGDEFGDEEMNLGAVEEEEDEINIDEFGNMDKEGVSEALLAWRHIESWTAKHNPDLNATLGDPCTHNDITHAEEDLAVTLPAAVRVSLRIHDGQEDLESMTGVSGLIYGLQLMTLDQIVEMTEKWRSVAKNLDRVSKSDREATVSSSSQSGDAMKKKQFKLPHIPQQDSIPRNSIQPVYAHPAWIPLLTDNAGNHVGVDLAPASEDFANDLEAGNWYLVDDNDDYLSGDGELVFRDKKSNGPAQDYLEVLKKRAWTKYQESAKSRDTQQTAVEPENAKDTTQISKVAVTDEASADEGTVQEAQIHSAVDEVPEAGTEADDREPTPAAIETAEPETDKNTKKTSAAASTNQSQTHEESSKAHEVSDKVDSKEGAELKNEQVKNESEDKADAQESNIESLKDEFKNIDL